MKDTLTNSSFIFICVVNSLSFYTAIVLNCVTIHAIRRTPSLPQTLKILLLSLASSDLGVGLVVQPCYIVQHVMELLDFPEDDPLYKAITHVTAISSAFFCSVSFLSTLALSADRFMVITFYLKRKDVMTSKRVLGIVVAIWFMCMFVAFDFSWMSRNIAFLIHAIIGVTGQTVLIFFNLVIYRASKAHLNQIKAMELTTSQGTQNASNRKEIINVARLRKFAKLSINVSIVFFVCYMPDICLLWAYALIPASRTRYGLISVLADTLCFLNSSVNPLIYCFAIGNIRRSIRKLTRGLLSSLGEERALKAQGDTKT